MAEENVNLENLKEAMDSKATASTEATDGAEASEATSAADEETPVETPPVTPSEPTIDENGRSYATGKRKNAVARV